VLPDLVSYHLLMAIRPWRDAVALLRKMQLVGLEPAGDSHNILPLRQRWGRAFWVIFHVNWNITNFKCHKS
jgi:hypothetical protein